jgi:CHASE2 domain-containing sensor protein
MAAPGRAPSLPPGRFPLHNGRMPAAFAKWLEKLRTPTAISLALGLVAGLLVIGLRSAGVLQFVELATYDIYLRAKERKSVPEPRVVLVQAFEPDIQKLAEWPLSDRNMAAVLNKLLAYEPRVVGVDLYRDIPVPPGHEDLVSLLKRDKRIVFIEKFGKDSSKRVAGPPALRGTEQIGFADITVDQDGVVRRGLLFLDDGKNFSLSLSLRLALAYLAEKGITPQPGSDDPTHMRLGSVTLKPFEANDGPYVHADAQGYQYMLDYRGGADRFKTYSISDVLEGRVDPRLIKDNVVIVGVNAESVKDEFLTPFDRFTRRGQTTAGIAVHGYEVSQLIRAALDGDAPIGFLADRVRAVIAGRRDPARVLCTLVAAGRAGRDRLGDVGGAGDGLPLRPRAAGETIPDGHFLEERIGRSGRRNVEAARQLPQGWSARASDDDCDRVVLGSGEFHAGRGKTDAHRTDGLAESLHGNHGRTGDQARRGRG